MADVVAWLEAELTRVEQLARAAADGDSGAWFVSDKWDVYRTEDQTPEDDIESNRLVVWGNVKLQSEHIAANDPAAVLRRLAADRQILAEHAPGDLIGIYGETECRTCSGPQPGFSGAWPMEWPCRTVQLLAQAYGWTEDAL